MNKKQDYDCNYENFNCCSDLSKLSNDNIQNMASLFKLLGDKSRLLIVMACINGEKSVSEIVETTGLSQSLVSHNLKSLKQNRILKSEKKGKFNYYTIDDMHIQHIINDTALHILE